MEISSPKNELDKGKGIEVGECSFPKEYFSSIDVISVNLLPLIITFFIFLVSYLAHF